MKHFKFLAMLLTAIAFTACSNNEDEFAKKSGNSIHLSTEIQGVATRAIAANNSNLQNTQFNEGAKINVYIQDAESPGSWIDGFSLDGYLTYTVNEYGQLENDYDAKYPSSNKVAVYAVYPERVDWGSSYFEVPITQTEESHFTNNDLMCATVASHDASEGTIKLNFKHCLSKIILKITPGSSGLNVSNIADLCINGLYRSIEISQNMGGLTLGSLRGSTDTIHLTDAATSDVDFANTGVTAIVIPQKVPAGTMLFDFSLGNVCFSYTTDTEIEFKAGCVHTITLTLDNSSINMTASQITKWDDSASNNHSGDATADGI